MDKIKTIYDYSVDEVYNQFCIINNAIKYNEDGVEYNGIYEQADKEVIFLYAFIAIVDHSFDIRNINREQVKEYLDLFTKANKLPEADRIKVISEFIINRNVRQLEKIKEESDMKFKNIITNINTDINKNGDKCILTLDESWNNNPFNIKFIIMLLINNAMGLLDVVKMNKLCLIIKTFMIRLQNSLKMCSIKIKVIKK